MEKAPKDTFSATYPLSPLGIKKKKISIAATKARAENKQYRTILHAFSPFFQSRKAVKTTNIGNNPADAWYVVHMRKVQINAIM